MEQQKLLGHHEASSEVPKELQDQEDIRASGSCSGLLCLDGACCIRLGIPATQGVCKLE